MDTFVRLFSQMLSNSLLMSSINNLAVQGVFLPPAQWLMVEAPELWWLWISSGTNWCIVEIRRNPDLSTCVKSVTGPNESIHWSPETVAPAGPGCCYHRTLPDTDCRNKSSLSISRTPCLNHYNPFQSYVLPPEKLAQTVWQWEMLVERATEGYLPMNTLSYDPELIKNRFGRASVTAKLQTVCLCEETSTRGM